MREMKVENSVRILSPARTQFSAENMVFINVFFSVYLSKPLLKIKKLIRNP
jgi:hypothetical protein